jgi:hypothetical protein
MIEVKNDMGYLNKYYIKYRLDELINNDLDKKRIYYYLRKNKFSIPKYIIESVYGDGECKCSELFL